MSRLPEKTPSLDTIGTVTLVDPEPARVLLLQQADRRQHALQTQWGGAGVWVPCYMGPTAALTLKVRVPPGVTHMRVAAMAAQSIHVTFTSVTDSTGCKLSWGPFPVDGGVQSAIFQQSLVVLDASANSTALRHVEVAASASWEWTDETFTLTCGGTAGHIYGVGFWPVHVAQ
jgi:hypothetical protein